MIWHSRSATFLADAGVLLPPGVSLMGNFVVINIAQIVSNDFFLTHIDVTIKVKLQFWVFFIDCVTPIFYGDQVSA